MCTETNHNNMTPKISRNDAYSSNEGTTLVTETPILEMASAELERMRCNETANGLISNNNSNHGPNRITHFPSSCLTLLKSLPANTKCIDCGDNNPQWASVSYGALLCLNCSGIHRSFGVQISCVRSTTMDNWTHTEVLAMLEGGNEQLQTFFERHHLCKETLIIKENNDTRSNNNSNSDDNDENNDNNSNSSKGSSTSSSSKRRSSDRKSISTQITPDNVNRLRYKTKAAEFYRQQMSLHVTKVLQHGEYKGREVSRRIRAAAAAGQRQNRASKIKGSSVGLNPRESIAHRNSTV